MSVLQKLQDRIRQKGLRRTFQTFWQRYVFIHRELLWMERDLLSPVPPHTLRPYEGLRQVTITPENADAFARHFGDRVETMRELAAEDYTGHMYLDAEGNAVAFIWGSKRDYHDRHYYGCWFPVKPGEFFEFGGEMARPYFGTCLSVDVQVNLWAAMQAPGVRQGGGRVRNRQHPGPQAAHPHGLSRTGTGHSRVRAVRPLAVVSRKPLHRLAARAAA